VTAARLDGASGKHGRATFNRGGRPLAASRRLRYREGMLAIISDIHSNLEALTTVYRWLDEHRIDDVICLGDVVGYGPDPNPVCDLIRQRCKVTLLGNHDAATIGAMETDYYRESAKEAIYWTRNELSDENFQWLFGLPFTHTRGELAFYHAAPLRPSRWAYVVHEQDADLHISHGMLPKMKRWNFVGHSHLTSAFAMGAKKARTLSGEVLSLDDESRAIVNVGSVGQPRDRDPRLCFGVYDDNFDTFRHVRLPYDIKSVANKIMSAGLDAGFARRLFEGR
jgi:diadenosine tetraphosphatase ApaH/serine/threonine PP2A family protein phosphatase